MDSWAKIFFHKKIAFSLEQQLKYHFFYIVSFGRIRTNGKTDERTVGLMNVSREKSEGYIAFLQLADLQWTYY